MNRVIAIITIYKICALALCGTISTLAGAENMQSMVSSCMISKSFIAFNAESDVKQAGITFSVER